MAIPSIIKIIVNETASHENDTRSRIVCIYLLPNCQSRCESFSVAEPRLAYAKSLITAMAAPVRGDKYSKQDIAWRTIALCSGKGKWRCLVDWVRRSARECGIRIGIVLCNWILSFRLNIGRLSGSYFSHFPCEIQRWLRKSRKSNARQHEHTSVECDSKIEKI